MTPPLVLFSLDCHSGCLPAFEESGFFGISVLQSTQHDLSVAFATMEQRHRWENKEFDIWETGAPLFKNAMARFDCKTYAIYDGGDHRIFVGEVLRFDADQSGDPLAFFRGRYRGVQPD